MQDHESEMFEYMLRANLKVKNASAPTDEDIAMWWSDLRDFSLEEVESAFNAHRRLSKFAPTAADLREIIRPNDGHPGPQEAWLIGKLLTDQKKSAWSTHQINEASDAVKYLIYDDEIAARKTFIEVYERAVAKARSEGEAAQWHVSEGDDYQGRKAAYLQALDKKLITREQIERKYPEMLRDVPENNLLMDGVVKLLGESRRMGASEQERKDNAERARKAIAEIKRKLAEG